MENLLTPEEVAEKLQVSVLTVKKWLRSGKLQGIKPGKLWRVEPEALEYFLHKEWRIKPEALAHFLDKETEAVKKTLHDMDAAISNAERIRKEYEAGADVDVDDAIKVLKGVINEAEKLKMEIVEPEVKVKVKTRKTQKEPSELGEKVKVRTRKKQKEAPEKIAKRA